MATDTKTRERADELIHCALLEVEAARKHWGPQERLYAYMRAIRFYTAAGVLYQEAGWRNDALAAGDDIATLERQIVKCFT